MKYIYSATLSLASAKCQEYLHGLSFLICKVQCTHPPSALAKPLATALPAILYCSVIHFVTAAWWARVEAVLSTRGKSHTKITRSENPCQKRQHVHKLFESLWEWWRQILQLAFHSVTNKESVTDKTWLKSQWRIIQVLVCTQTRTAHVIHDLCPTFCSCQISVIIVDQPWRFSNRLQGTSNV